MTYFSFVFLLLFFLLFCVSLRTFIIIIIIIIIVVITIIIIIASSWPIVFPLAGTDRVSTTSLGSRGHMIHLDLAAPTATTTSTTTTSAACRPVSLQFAVLLDALLSGHEDWFFALSLLLLLLF